MVKPILHAPLDALRLATRAADTSGDAGVVLSDGGRLAIVNVRLKPDAPQAVKLVEERLGLPLPKTAGQTSSSEDKTLVWLGPDLWLLVASNADGGALAQTLSDDLVDHAHSCVDVSHNYGIIEVTGPQAHWLLQKAILMNLSEDAFPVGRAVATNFAKAQAIVHLIETDPLFRLFVRRSFCAYVWQWLEAASKEVGFSISNNHNE